MSDTEIVFFVIKLFFGTLIAFFAIMLWSKTRDLSWMLLVLAAVTGYSSIVFELLLKLGFVDTRHINLLGIEIPLIQLALLVAPNLFVVAAFVLMLIRSGR